LISREYQDLSLPAAGPALLWTAPAAAVAASATGLTFTCFGNQRRAFDDNFRSSSSRSRRLGTGSGPLAFSRSPEVICRRPLSGPGMEGAVVLAAVEG